ncbi:5-formyltetrahydrofolate cyclo-ligase [Bacillus carboniphilus]|uniref:5-formyltetrahydrofolate cyclo-ligase n=1 Tax=Bacillus carboniphilus TaxID=86663 RepID=A0ABY9K0C2_9BACI|nr:5-formyltetrahydrofolate cyclo-ligase [Bacillus carboniphilus]WLR44282.1 5-formyltetrahydrofolate cyclo-ligase [Bacillus carboniphilus]
MEEPKVKQTIQTKRNEIDLLFVPGVCFDNNGYRIGYGGGFFDKFLKDYKNQTVALAYHFQIISYIPVERHDVPVNKIISNRGVHVIKDVYK